MYGITGEHYAIDGDVLPILDLHPAVEPRIDIEQAGAMLFIRPREYEWPRGCPDVCSVRAGSNIPPPSTGRSPSLVRTTRLRVADSDGENRKRWALPLLRRRWEPVAQSSLQSGMELSSNPCRACMRRLNRN
jgi:hypothetical protein